MKKENKPAVTLFKVFDENGNKRVEINRSLGAELIDKNRNDVTQSLVEHGFFGKEYMEKIGGLKGQPFKALVAIMANTSFPSATHYNTRPLVEPIVQMAGIKSEQDKRNRYSWLMKGGWIKKISHGFYMLNPSVFFIGTPEEKQKAIEQYNKI